MADRALRRRLGRLVPDVIARSYLVKFLAVLILILVLIGGVGAVTYAETTAELESDAEAEYVALAQLIGAETTAWEAERGDIAREAASEVAEIEDPDDAMPALRWVQQETAADVVGVHLVEREGATVLASSADDPPEAFNPPRFDHDAVGDGSVIVTEQYQPRHLTGGAMRTENRIAFVAAVDEDRVVAVETSIDWALAELNANDHATVALVDEDGSILGSDGDLRGSYEGENWEAMEGATEPAYLGTTGSIVTDWDEQVTAYAPVEGTDWTAVVHVSPDDAFAVADGVAQSILVMLAVAVVGLGLLGATLGRDTVVELNRLGARAHDLEAGELDVDLSTHRRDELGQLYGSFDSMRDSLRDEIETASTQRERAERAKAESEAFAEQLSRRAAEFGETMRACADGDLTARIDARPDDPEALREVATAFNETMADLEGTVAEVDAFAEEVADASEAVAAGADEVVEAGRETSDAVDEISAGAERQSTDLGLVADEMEDMSATIEEVAASAEEVARTSERADERTVEGRDAAAAAVDELHTIDRRSESAAETIAALEAEMSEVDAIVETIAEIADRTNLLALNASIEAARAGEAGSGFAVVAEEVKRLAEETQSSAAEVESLIDDLGERTDASVEEMATIRERVEEGVAVVEAAETALADVSEQVAAADDGVQEITGAMDAQANAVSEVTGAVDELAGISEQTTAEATTVASTAEEQVATLGTVSESAHELERRASALRERVGRFEVDATDGAIDFDASEEPVEVHGRTAEVDGRTVEATDPFVDATVVEADSPGRATGDPDTGEAISDGGNDDGSKG